MSFHEMFLDIMIGCYQCPTCKLTYRTPYKEVLVVVKDEKGKDVYGTEIVLRHEYIEKDGRKKRHHYLVRKPGYSDIAKSPMLSKDLIEHLKQLGFRIIGEKK